jgi:hypothetical protein
MVEDLAQSYCSRIRREIGDQLPTTVYDYETRRMREALLSLKPWH